MFRRSGRLLRLIVALYPVAIQALVLGGKAELDGPKADYYINYFTDKNCTKVGKASQHDALRLTSAAGCYDIVGGPNKGRSFALACSKSDDDIVQVVYGSRNCRGAALSSKTTKWGFFQGECRHQEKLHTGLKLADYPKCKQNATGGNASASPGARPLAAKLAAPVSELAREGEPALTPEVAAPPAQA
mmetsp:Transcript_96091/g.272020  ORF Transcript_96091/g.272020 Transcript_96091/m.272020 type:complete len:188 (-) Transcript_96091:377-940(-)